MSWIRDRRWTRLTARQRRVLAWIERYLADHGRAPSLAEICTAFRWGVSTNAVAYHLRALELKGCIARERFTPRGIRVLVSAEVAP